VFSFRNDGMSLFCFLPLDITMFHHFPLIKPHVFNLQHKFGCVFIQFLGRFYKIKGIFDWKHGAVRIHQCPDRTTRDVWASRPEVDKYVVIIVVV
jgi:hypothetical protein